MRVIPYYCAQCGVRMQAEDARFGQSKTDARTYYCPSCVVDLNIAVADSGGVALESDSEASGRAGPVQSAFDLSRSKRLALRNRQSPSGSLRGRKHARAPRAASPPRTIWFVLLAGALGIAGLVTGRTWRTDDTSGDTSGDTTREASPPDTGEATPPSASQAGDEPASAPPPRAAVRPTTAPDPTPRAAPTPYVLNRRTGTLHIRGCRWERRMSADNRRPFPDLDAVRTSGLRFKRCRTCLRDK